MTTDSIISKVWSFCTTLRDDGVGYGDYLEQLTYLIFLKMADEYGRPPHKREVSVLIQLTQGSEPWSQFVQLECQVLGIDTFDGGAIGRAQGDGAIFGIRS